jgi:hypothetical protein
VPVVCKWHIWSFIEIRYRNLKVGRSVMAFALYKGGGSALRGRNAPTKPKPDYK